MPHMLGSWPHQIGRSARHGHQSNSGRHPRMRRLELYPHSDAPAWPCPRHTCIPTLPASMWRRLRPACGLQATVRSVPPGVSSLGGGEPVPPSSLRSRIASSCACSRACADCAPWGIVLLRGQKSVKTPAEEAVKHATSATSVTRGE